MGTTFSRISPHTTSEIGLGPLSHEEVRDAPAINADGSPQRQPAAQNSSAQTPHDVESLVVVRTSPRWNAKRIAGAAIGGALLTTAAIAGGVVLAKHNNGVKTPNGGNLPSGKVGAGGSDSPSAPTAYDFATPPPAYDFATPPPAYDFATPPPPPALTIKDLSPNTLAHLQGASLRFSEDSLIKILNTWNMSEPIATLSGREKEHYVGATYRNSTAPLYSTLGLPQFTNVAIDAGDTLAQIRPGEKRPIGSFDDPIVQASGTAMAALSAANPGFVKSMLGENQLDGTYTLSAKFESSDLPGAAASIPLIVSQRVLTDFAGEVLGVNLKDQGTVLWPAILRKVFTKFAQQEAEPTLSNVENVFRMATGRTPLVTDLTRSGDSDAWTKDNTLSLSGQESALIDSAEGARPSLDFDAHMDALVNSPGAAAVFELRSPPEMPFMEGYDAETEKVPFGTHSFIAPALRGAAIQVLSETTNEIVSAKAYVFVGADKSVDGTIESVSLWDPSSETLDCATINSLILSGEYKGNPFTGTKFDNPTDIDARFSEWDTLPRKEGLVRLPYEAFKLLASELTQVHTIQVQENNGPDGTTEPGNAHTADDGSQPIDGSPVGPTNPNLPNQGGPVGPTNPNLPDQGTGNTGTAGSSNTGRATDPTQPDQSAAAPDNGSGPTTGTAFPKQPDVSGTPNGNKR